jgi:hypothetical protein
MSTEAPGLNGSQNVEDHPLDARLASLSLSSKTIHADDFLNKGQDVAPPLHVSTTFRYSKNPDDLVPAAELDVCLPSIVGGMEVS